MAIVAGVTAVVGLAVQLDANADTKRARREGRAIASASQKSEDAAKLRKQAREARITRARILQSSEANGGGSRESGAIGSLSTQLGEQQGRVSGQQNTAEALGGINQQISDAQSQKALGGSIKNIGVSSFEKAGGFDNLFKDS